VTTSPPKPTLSQITVKPLELVVGTIAEFSATATPAAVKWSWEISDADSNPVKIAADPGKFAFAFPQAGTFTVKVTVTDEAGQKAEEKLEVKVNAAANPP
jgi:PKD repeat protein